MVKGYVEGHTSIPELGLLKNTYPESLSAKPVCEFTKFGLETDKDWTQNKDFGYGKYIKMYSGINSLVAEIMYRIISFKDHTSCYKDLAGLV